MHPEDEMFPGDSEPGGDESTEPLPAASRYSAPCDPVGIIPEWPLDPSAARAKVTVTKVDAVSNTIWMK